MSELSSHHNFLLFSMSFLSYSSSPQHRLCSPYTQLCADWPNPALTGFSKESCPNQGLPGSLSPQRAPSLLHSLGPVPPLGGELLFMVSWLGPRTWSFTHNCVGLGQDIQTSS